MIALIILSALIPQIGKEYQFLIFILAGSTLVSMLLFILSLFPNVNKIVIDMFPICFLCMQMLGILTLDFKTDGKYKEAAFCDQIGALNLVLSLITLIFLRVNWFFIWIASLIIFIALTVIFALTLKTNLFQRREDVIILISNLVVYLASYCFEYMQLKYWLQKQLF